MAPPRHPRLTPHQRVEIAREHAKGVSPQELATRFGVSRQTVHATVRSHKSSESASVS